MCVFGCVFCACWEVFKFLYWISYGIVARRSFGDGPVRELVIKFGSHHWYASRNVHDPVPFAPIALYVPANMRISMHGFRVQLDIGWIAPGKYKIKENKEWVKAFLYLAGVLFNAPVSNSKSNLLLFSSNLIFVKNRNEKETCAVLMCLFTSV